ncbi:UNVERIFIED_CONTAM: hypothetical protein Sradi_3253100 [Sesamum radiatum]|uniref:Reverse transcriptase domain-containing protein n=1 Tax=Sesamum radiatum TaxID=300843 RepID=A0AAW2QZY6_SESRA
MDIPPSYNLILGRPALNTSHVVVSTYHMKLKFLVGDGVGEVRGDQYTVRKCYVEAIKSSNNQMEVDIPNKESNKNFPQQEDQRGAVPTRVQPAEELLSIQLVPREPDKIIKIGSQLSLRLAGQLITLLQQNADIFAWIANDLIGIDPSIDVHTLNVDPTFSLVKQKKRHFKPRRIRSYKRRKFNFHNVMLIPKLGYHQIMLNLDDQKRKEIEVNSEKIRAIKEIKPPSNLNEVQRLAGRIAALSRFISRLAEWSLPSFKDLRKPMISSGMRTVSKRFKI